MPVLGSVNGNPTRQAGLTSRDGKLKVHDLVSATKDKDSKCNGKDDVGKMMKKQFEQVSSHWVDYR